MKTRIKMKSLQMKETKRMKKSMPIKSMRMRKIRFMQTNRIQIQKRVNECKV